MKYLVGTGLVGTQLKNHHQFEYCFDSKTIDSIKNVKPYSDLYLACPSGTKWKTNLDPNRDLFNIIDLYNNLSQVSWGTIHLFSSIDVYQYSDLGLAEESTPYLPNKIDYATNRRRFEILVESLDYKDFNCWRLPGLFAKHMTKNIIWDLIHSHDLHKINPNSFYQWYNLEWLDSDIRKYYKPDIKFYNLFTEPIKTQDIIDFTGHSCTGESLIYYDWTTNLEDYGYVRSYFDVLESIKQVIKDW